jgi:hypothetical protein
VRKEYPRIRCTSHIKADQPFGTGAAEDVFDDNIRISSLGQIIRLGLTFVALLMTCVGLMKVAMKTLEPLAAMVNRACFTQSQGQESRSTSMLADVSVE